MGSEMCIRDRLRRVRSNQGDLFLVGIDDELQKIFGLCGLDKIFKMDFTRETFQVS